MLAKLDLAKCHPARQRHRLQCHCLMALQRRRDKRTDNLMEKFLIDAPQHRWAWRRSARAAAVACVVITGAISGQPAFAWDNCEVWVPGFDGVLRLDTDKASTWRRHRRPRASQASPKQFEMNTARAKSGPVQSEAESHPAPDNRPANEDVLRLKDETARLNEEMSRLKDEASSLRNETVRLKDQLALRDAALPGKIESKLDQSGRGEETTTPAPKGNLLEMRSRQTEIKKIPPEHKIEAQGPEAHSSDEPVFDRRKGMTERAWQQLIDFAVRMKKDLSGEPAR